MQFTNLHPKSDRTLRFRQFLKERLPKDDDVEKGLQFISQPEIIFETFEQLKIEQIYSNLYVVIIDNLRVFGTSENEIETFLLLADKIAFTAFLGLESNNVDEKKYFMAVKNMMNDRPFNTFQKCLFFKLCAIWVNDNKLSGSTNTKQDIFGKLCDDESWMMGNTIGFYMPGNTLSGIWIAKKNTQSEPLVIVKETTTATDIKPEKMEGKVSKLQWKKKVPLLVYLFHLLQENEVISGDEWGANLSSIFVDSKYKEIKNTTINEYKQRFKNLGTQPHDKGTVESIVSLLRELDGKLEK